MKPYIQMAHVRLRECQRRIIRLFGGRSNRDIEYDFAYRNIAGDGLQVLDVGGTQSLLPLQYAKRGFNVTVLDFRSYPESHKSITSIKGDFLENDLKDNSFDYITMVSTIEHIGFGSYDAPVHQDGDLEAMKQVQRLLKPDGKAILTFPFASKEHHVDGFERWYDIERLKLLFKDFNVLAEEYYVPGVYLLGRIVKWEPASLEQITSKEDVVKEYGSQCNACFLISKKPRENFN